MFEFEREIVESLVGGNKQFEELFNQHNSLKDQVRDAELGVLPLDTVALENMKKEKLLTKDRMAAMIEDYKRVNSSY